MCVMQQKGQYYNVSWNDKRNDKWNDTSKITRRVHVYAESDLIQQTRRVLSCHEPNSSLDVLARS